MPTNTNAYNSRVTDEALEKRFRDTFRAQGGAELVDDLYAQGVIVPIVDFTAAATGQQLAENLQTAWDFSTGSAQVTNTTTTIVSTAGFWQVGFTLSVDTLVGANETSRIRINDGSTTKNIWGFTPRNDVGVDLEVPSSELIVFLRSGDDLEVVSPSGNQIFDLWYRQIATVSGDLVNPTGFTSS